MNSGGDLGLVELSKMKFLNRLDSELKTVNNRMYSIIQTNSILVVLTILLK